MGEGHVVEIVGILKFREEKEDVLEGEAGERRDIGGAEGAGNVPVAGDDASEGVEVAVIRRGVVAGVILTTVTKEVAGRRLGYGGVNARKDLGGVVWGCCFALRSRAMLLTESVRRVPMLWLDAPSAIGENGDEASGEDEGEEAATVEDVVAAVAAAAAAASAAARWDVLVLRVMRKLGGGVRN
ncbi:hypothetical protein CBR_g48828 [Chara braunii]|uniref:Uncharacterized protein n=1 Tax=Chara braunii TaxID=69332 RepID=A0A388M3F2_CHABU|nr:hypothetical protein CBR_g48828 [Chara braunii]|eukprot:GBG89118.1 hypothetical protein CBR_g48828 [Chara braunii]